MMVGFGRLRNLLVSQSNFHLFSYEISIQYVLIHYEISMTVSFAGLRDFNDSQFCSIQ